MDIPPLKTATCQLLSSTCIMMVVVVPVERPWTLPAPGMETWLALIGLALFGTAVAYVVFFENLARAGASNVMLVTLLIPVTALLLGSLFLAEPLIWHELAGAAIIGLGLLFIDGRLPRRGEICRTGPVQLSASLRRFRNRRPGDRRRISRGRRPASKTRQQPAGEHPVGQTSICRFAAGR